MSAIILTPDLSNSWKEFLSVFTSNRDAIILVPAVLSCWIVARRSASAAFFDVWLPCFMLLPMYYFFRPPHMPPLGFTDTAAIPISVVMFGLYLKKWDWRLMDGLILAFILLLTISETMHTGTHVGGLQLFSAIYACLFPYMAGRIFIEQPGARTRFIQRFMVLLCLVTLLSVWDFVGCTSIFQRFWSHFFPGEVVVWPIQLRWGFGRIAGPYAQSILAGMMFLIGVLLSTGIRHFAPEWGRRRIFNFLPFTVRTLVTTLLVAGLLMTQSRGPVFGALIGLIILQIARAYNLKRASILITGVVLVALIGGYKMIQDYTQGDLTAATTLEQQNAIYRKQLWGAYSKTIQDGGLLGWGETEYPKAPGQDSIDNQYLLLMVTQGYIGLAVFVWISLLTLWDLVRMLPFATGPPDKWLLFTLISIFVGLLLTITTVFLGEQMYQMFFLLIGWVQALRTPMMVRLQKERRSPAPLVKVYT